MESRREKASLSRDSVPGLSGVDSFMLPFLYAPWPLDENVGVCGVVTAAGGGWALFAIWPWGVPCWLCGATNCPC